MRTQGPAAAWLLPSHTHAATRLPVKCWKTCCVMLICLGIRRYLPPVVAPIDAKPGPSPPCAAQINSGLGRSSPAIFYNHYGSSSVSSDSSETDRRGALRVSVVQANSRNTLTGSRNLVYDCSCFMCFLQDKTSFCISRPGTEREGRMGWTERRK